MPPIWILEESRDGGKTWRVSSPYQVWKVKQSADKKLDTYKGWRWLYRITEYHAVCVEGKV
jgi:hypothetical protein